MATSDESEVPIKVAKRLARWSALLAGRRAASDFSNKELKAVDRLVREQQYDNLRRRCQLRELAPLEIFQGLEKVCVPLSAIDEESGHANHAEMHYVTAAASLRHARRIFEFGTFMGRTALHFARMNPAANVWTLDLPAEANPRRFAGHIGTYFADTPEAGRIHCLRCDARTFDPSPHRAAMDFIWVDGDHSYEGVKNDTEKAFDMLAPGGAIFWHDFGPDSLELVHYIVDLTKHRPLFHIRRTSLLVHLDGVDPLTFVPHPVPFSKTEIR